MRLVNGIPGKNRRSSQATSTPPSTTMSRIGTWDSVTARTLVLRPRQEVLGGPGVDDGRRIHPARSRASAPVGLPGELAGRVRVGVDAELAPRLDRQPQKPF